MHELTLLPLPSLTCDAAGRARNVMTVDVEEYFHVAALSEAISPADWPRLPSRVGASVERLLVALADADAHATFFILGWVAERHPALVRAVARAGHEVASHGYWHQPAYRQTPAEFAEDARRSKAVLEDALGAPVLGYRAASFSIVARNQWAFAELDRLGFRYSSSVHPIAHDIYGFPDAPRTPFRPAGTQQLVECPVSTLELAGRRLPCAGGGYFRLLPYAWFRWAIQRLNAAGQPMLFYLHPWEIDPEQPVVDGLSWRSRWRHYNNLHRTERRLRRLLADFAWDRFDRWLGLAPAATPGTAPVPDGTGNAADWR
jgi:polysaccharide deacetylase family protein (PEP-CTERM system associated)